MNRSGTGFEAISEPAWTPTGRADTWMRATVTVTVAGLAGIAGAISYSHMRNLAAAHGETGWQAHAFPLSVDGIEIVASLVLLADRRAGRPSGWLPWAALAAGTTASLAANVAAAGTDLIGRVVAGWPAFALLVAIKLLSGLFQRRPDDRPPAVEDRPASLVRSPADGDGSRTHAGPVPGSEIGSVDGRAAVDVVNGARLAPAPGARNGLSRDPGTAAAPVIVPGSGAGTIKETAGGTGTTTRVEGGDESDVAALLPAARAARDRLSSRGDVLTRDTLAAELRRSGHPVRNAKVSQILTALKGEPVAGARDGISRYASA
jgi:hypothetical protein